MESQPHDLGEVAFDEWLFPSIVKNNSQYRKRFHIDNYADFKKSFIHGDKTILPVYEYLDDSKYSQKKANLENFRNSLHNDTGINETVKTLYLDKITEKQLLLDLVRYACLAQADTAEGRLASIEFKRVTEQVFGVPEINIFNHLCQVITREIELVDEDIQHSEAFKVLHAIVANKVSFGVSPYTNALTINNNEQTDYVTEADVVIDFFKQRMQKIGLSDWNVHLTEKPIGSFRVVGSKKTVFVPKSSVLQSRKLHRRLTPAVMEGLFNHEILTHVVRAVNGSHSRLKLLSHGLAGYLKGEEGIATYREQLHSPHTDYSGGVMYFALGLAYGLDRGGIMRNFSEVYSLLCDYFFLKYSHQEKGFKSKAFSTCCRIFVFSGDVSKQLVFTRDIVYRAGNIEIHSLVKSEPLALDYFDVGKYDPCNQFHLKALKELGLLPV